MDVEKVLAQANRLGPQQPVSLRWEGSGDSVHAYNVLRKLQIQVYQGTQVPIKYHAVINIYEPFENNNSQRAWNYMSSIHQSLTLHPDTRTGEVLCDEFFNAGPEQHCFLYYGMDMTRPSRSANQPPANVMFVRNIMGTSNYSDSLTDQSEPLLALHTGAIRSRANSIESKGQLELGMSGRPGFLRSSMTQTKLSTKIQDAFYGFGDLVQAGSDAGIPMKTNKATAKAAPLQLSDNRDSGPVMKNAGAYKTKNTFYLTFQNPH